MFGINYLKNDKQNKIQLIRLSNENASDGGESKSSDLQKVSVLLVQFIQLGLLHLYAKEGAAAE